MSNDLDFCPECQIGLNTTEIHIGKCVNCGATWDPNDIALYDDDEEDV